MCTPSLLEYIWGPQVYFSKRSSSPSEMCEDPATCTLCKKVFNNFSVVKYLNKNKKKEKEFQRSEFFFFGTSILYFLYVFLVHVIIFVVAIQITDNILHDLINRFQGFLKKIKNCINGSMCILLKLLLDVCPI